MKAVKNVSMSYVELHYICVKFNRTNQNCSYLKINQPINNEWQSCD